MTFRNNADPNEIVSDIAFLFQNSLLWQVENEGLQHADAIAGLLARTLCAIDRQAHVASRNFVYVNHVNFGKNFWVLVDQRVAVWVIHKNVRTLDDFRAPMIKIAQFLGYGIQTAMLLNFEHTEDHVNLITAKVTHAWQGSKG